MTCSTHHNACDCRESKFSDLQKEVERLREALLHISSDKPRCEGCDSPDVSLSEHYSFIAKEALNEPPMCKHGKSRVHITHLGIDKCNECGEYVPQNALKEPRSAKREGCGLCYEGKPCNMAACPDDVEAQKEPQSCEHEWEGASLFDEQNVETRGEHCMKCLTFRPQKEPQGSEATKGSLVDPNCKHEWRADSYGYVCRKCWIYKDAAEAPKSPPGGT